MTSWLGRGSFFLIVSPLDAATPAEVVGRIVVLLREGARELFLAKGDVGDRAGASSVGGRLEAKVEILMRAGAAVLLLDKPDAGGKTSAVSAVDGKAVAAGLGPAFIVLERSTVGWPMGSVLGGGTVALLLSPSSSLS